MSVSGRSPELLTSPSSTSQPEGTSIETIGSLAWLRVLSTESKGARRSPLKLNPVWKKKKRKEERRVVAWRVKEKRLLTEDGIHHQVVAFEDSSVHYLEKRNIEIGSLLGQILKKRRKTPLKKWQNL